MIAYLTDLEGQWDKLVSFADGNPLVALDGERLVLAPGATFVFGGDAIDRGPGDRKILRALLAARRAYGERVIWLAGNRDVNKLRLARELAPVAPGERAERLRWTLARTMGAPNAFAFRAQALAADGAPHDDAAVVDSYLADLAPGGELREYLLGARLAYRAGATLFVHGGVTAENLGVVPGREPVGGVDAWIAALGDFYGDELARFCAGDEPAALIAYQGPLPGTRANDASVIYARPTDDVGNPRLPLPDVIARLAADGIARVVVGHTPSGDCPAVVRDERGFELVLADNSYGRIERGSHLALTDGETAVRGVSQLDDGSVASVDYASLRAERSPLGTFDAHGALRKARLADGRYLLFRGLPHREVLQTAERVPL